MSGRLEVIIVYILSGHTSFVYSLSVLPNGDIVSSGEDLTVRVWKGMFLLFFHSSRSNKYLFEMASSHRLLSYPSGRSPMPNGDIVSGSSDGIV